MSTTPTIKDVAEAAGVAVSTVSSTLNGKASQRRIGRDAQQRVLDAARRLGYQANPTARGMALGTVPASIPQPSQIATPEAQLPNPEIALVLTTSSPAESLALIPSLEPVLTAANFRLFVVTLPAEPTAARGRLTRMLDDDARPASDRRTVGFLCCPTVYPTVSTLLAGRCPAIVLWQGAAKAMVATIANPSSAVPIVSTVDTASSPEVVKPTQPQSPPPAVTPRIVAPPAAVEPKPKPMPEPEPEPSAVEAPVTVEPVAQQIPGSPKVRPPEEIPAETAVVEPAPEPTPEPEPEPVAVEAPVTVEPVAQQVPDSPEVSTPEEIPAETAVVEPAPEPTSEPEPEPVAVETPVTVEPVVQQVPDSPEVSTPEEIPAETAVVEPVPEPTPEPEAEPVAVEAPVTVEPVAQQVPDSPEVSTPEEIPAETAVVESEPEPTPEEKPK